VGREARARGLVMETQDKQYMVMVFVCLLLDVGVGFFFFNCPTR
jgi:hypothetical protein